MDVKLPRLGEGADSGSVVNIFVKEGDEIKKDQVIIELENEKAVASIPSPASGKVTKVHVKEGDKISVGQSILSISEEGAQKGEKEEKTKEAPREKKRDEKHESKKEEVEEESEGETKESEEFEEPAKPGLAPAASPSIRKMARELGIDLNRVKGSERGGRIVLDDVKGYIQRLQEFAFGRKAEKPVEKPPKLAQEPIDFSKWGSVHKKPMSSLRQAISRKMVESWTTIPHITQFEDADITLLMDLRKKYAPAFEKKGARLTLTSFILKALIPVLKKYPVFNSSLDETTQEIVFKDYYHIGIAVDTEQGLIVPVLRDVDKKNMLDLSKELDSLAEKTRQRKVSLEELKGGTFTISNQGGIGGAHFTPIINKPEVAILGLGRGTSKPLVKDGKTEIRSVLPLGLSYDHRVIDGADAARFIVEFVKVLQEFKEEDVKG